MKDKPPAANQELRTKNQEQPLRGSLLQLQLELSTRTGRFAAYFNFKTPAVTHSGVFYYLLDFTIHYSKFTIPPPGGWRLCVSWPPLLRIVGLDKPEDF